MFDTIKVIGYDGIELWQHPDVLKRELGADPAEKLLTALQRVGLKLLGVSSGSLSEKIAFIKRLIQAEQFASVRAKGPHKPPANWMLLDIAPLVAQRMQNRKPLPGKGR